MPVNVSLMKALRKKYGAEKGTQVYYGMESKGGKAFKKGLKTAKKEKHTVKNLKAYKAKKKG